MDIDETESERRKALDQEGADESAASWTLLYIEENLSNVKLLEIIIARRPELRLVSAMQGRIGIELAWQRRPDVILFDLLLPGMEDEDVLRQLHELPATRDIPVVLISADGTPSQAERLLAAGARAYLTKPIRVQEFLSVVDGALRAEGA